MPRNVTNLFSEADSVPTPIVSGADGTKRSFKDAFEGDHSDPDDAEAEANIRPSIFAPLHIGTSWTEPKTTIDMYTLVVVLPSGIGEGMFGLRVIEDGKALELTVDWPKPIRDVSLMHRKWLRPDAEEGFTSYHPRCVSFENALKKLRSSSSQKIKSIAKFHMPFPVRKDIVAQHNLILPPDDTKLIYVDLKGVSADYAETHNHASFEHI